MKHICALAVLTVAFALPAMAEDGGAPAATPPALSAQAQKMQSCNAEYRAKQIPSVEHRKFMKACLKKGYVPGSYGAAQPVKDESGKPLTAQQLKMKSCNKDAGDKALLGQERQAFIASCLGAGAAQ